MKNILSFILPQRNTASILSKFLKAIDQLDEVAEREGDRVDALAAERDAHYRKMEASILVAAEEHSRAKAAAEKLRRVFA